MAVELNMLRASPENHFCMSPRRIQGLWLTAKTIEREKEKRMTSAMRWAQAEDKAYAEHMKV